MSMRVHSWAGNSVEFWAQTTHMHSQHVHVKWNYLLLFFLFFLCDWQLFYFQYPFKWNLLVSVRICRPKAKRKQIQKGPTGFIIVKHWVNSIFNDRNNNRHLTIRNSNQKCRSTNELVMLWFFRIGSFIWFQKSNWIFIKQTNWKVHYNVKWRQDLSH